MRLGAIPPCFLSRSAVHSRKESIQMPLESQVTLWRCCFFSMVCWMYNAWTTILGTIFQWNAELRPDCPCSIILGWKLCRWETPDQVLYHGKYLSSSNFIDHITGAGFLYKRCLCFGSYLFSATPTYSPRIRTSRPLWGFIALSMVFPSLRDLS